MKYIKKFEYTDKSKEDRLKYFCETHLSYLLDDGFNIEIIYGYAQECYNIILSRLDNESYQGFTWSEIKDSLVPFLTLLNNEYDILSEFSDTPSLILYNGNQNYPISITDILSGKPLPLRYDNVDLLEIKLKVA